MNAWLIPLGLLGLLVGGQLNRAIYRWAWNARLISPWSNSPEGAPPRTWLDRVPVMGWWGMRRESKLHGTAHWVRPMLIELACCIGLPALYSWDVLGGRMPIETFASHSVLFSLMIIATFIDFNEKTIPDYITVPGTVFAVLFAIVAPNSLLPSAVVPNVVLLTTPQAWSTGLDGVQGLLVGLFCWFGWCYAILPKTFYWRRGLRKGMQFLFASIIRERLSYYIGIMCVVGVAVIAGVWSQNAVPGWSPSWQSALSSLAGLAFGGGLVWMIRLVAGQILGVEAMGFGDVTLMAMIGAFLGWQAAMITFFLAPFTSVFIALTQWIVTGRRDIAFGPFLCAGASIVMIGWQTIWARWGAIFGLGPFIPAIVVVGIGLMGVMLGILQMVKRALGIETR